MSRWLSDFAGDGLRSLPLPDGRSRAANRKMLCITEISVL